MIKYLQDGDLHSGCHKYEVRHFHEPFTCNNTPKLKTHDAGLPKIQLQSLLGRLFCPLNVLTACILVAEYSALIYLQKSAEFEPISG